MAVVYVAEFVSVGGTGNFPIAGAMVAPVAQQTIAIGTVSAPGSAFNANTYFVRVHTDAICCISFGTTPTVSTTTGMRMAANQTEYFAVPLGASYKVAVITAT
jgi:hypothetical protein